MALFHLNVSSIGKSSGSSAVASAAYRSCSQLTQSVIDPRTGLKIEFIHNFSNKQGLAFSQIFVQDGVASWCSNREELWNKVEERETHTKGRFARDIKLALQKEFTLEQNIQLLSEYVKNTFVKDGIIADVNIHLDDPNNPHAHIMLTTRVLEQNDKDEWYFGNKNRLLDSKGWIKYIRTEWADINNKYFVIYDIDKSITHESYESRGIEFVQATIHEGAALYSESEEKILDRTEYNRNIVKSNLQYIKENPDKLIQALAKDKSSKNGGFSRADLFKEIDAFLNEIALRNGDHHVLLVEAKNAVLGRCDVIFDKINKFDIALTNDFNNTSQYQHEIGISSGLQENVASLIEDFYQRIENVVKVKDEIEFIKGNPAKLIEKVSKDKAIFSKPDLAKALDSHINEIMNEVIINELNNDNIEQINKIKGEVLDKYDDLFDGLLNSKELVKLVDNDLSGKEIYTTKEQLALEELFIKNIENLSNSKQHALNLNVLNPVPEGIKTKIVSSLTNLVTSDAKVWLENIFTPRGKPNDITLSAEQNEAVLRLVNGGDLIALTGMPGTGKSTVMAKLVAEYKTQGYEVIGAAVSAIAALNLANEAGIKTNTLSKWQYDWDKRIELEKAGEEVRNLLPMLTNKSVMIIDEMSMVDLKTFNYLTTKAIEVGAKLVVVGDNNQFSAIGVAGASEKVTEKCENVVLTELFRQREDLDKEITKKLSNYKVDEALIMLDQENRIRIGNNPDITRAELVNHYIGQTQHDNYNNHKNNETRIVIAYRNNEVKELNLEIRNRLLNSGLLKVKDYKTRGINFRGKDGDIKIAIGEQLVFTKNQRYLGVLNGQLGKVVEIVDDSRFKVQLLGKNTKGENYNKVITINSDKFNSFAYGYAITSYKSQGKTYDHSYLLIDKSVGYEAFNVMATRHRISSLFYIDRNVLKDIVTRKFDIAKAQSVDTNQLVGYENAALFELLSRRNSNSLAHDFIGYEQKPEVMQIREYIEARDKASNIYHNLLEWQDNESKHGRKVELWHNKKLWSKFIELKIARQQCSQELVEGYPQYQKYIKASVINYATLLKHADMASIEFNYRNNDASHLQFASIESKEIDLKYQEFLGLEKICLTKATANSCKALLAKTEELISIQEQSKSNLANLSSQICELENKKCALESQRKANIYYCEDIKHYLNQSYKDGAKEVLSKWDKLNKTLGTEKALLKVKLNPESLGDLKGVGWGAKLAVSSDRALAVFNVKSLSHRLAEYNKSITEEVQLTKEIHHKETVELAHLRNSYDQANSIKLMSYAQEKHLYDIQEHRENLDIWLKAQVKVSDKSRDQDISGDNLKEVNSKVALKSKKETTLEQKTATIKENEIFARENYSYEQLHNKLADDIVALSQRLLPNMSNKQIEIQKNKIQCGSIHIEKNGDKRGLWYRFSNSSEKGDLFDLIKTSQRLASKSDAIQWGRGYLGLETSNSANYSRHHNQIDPAEISKKIENLSKNKELNFKILSPVPQNADVFNPELVFAPYLQNKQGEFKKINGVYAYKNINNELCGYAVRIENLDTKQKVTLPVVYTKNKNGIRSWRAKGLGENRCLYNEQRLHNSNKPVLIVEGEKTVDSAQSLYPEFDVVSWSGGVNGFNKTNWNVLQNKQVTIWPDNDKPGISAAHNIKDLLISNKITEPKIIDINKIDYLPEKWDLADHVPDNVRQHQITGMLFASEGIETKVRINKTTLDYIGHRQNSLNEDLKNKELKSFGEYFIEKEKIKYQLYYENILVKEQLKTKTLLSVRDEFEISLEAKEQAENNIKSFGLLNDAKDIKIETISDYIQQDLAKIYTLVPHEVLIKTANVAIEYSKEIISKDSRFNNSHLPIFSLRLASEIIERHYNINNEIKAIDHANANNNFIHQEQQGIQLHDHSSVDSNHSIDMVRTAFKIKIEQEHLHFEHNQQQQQTQKQMSHHSEIEI